MGQMKKIWENYLNLGYDSTIIRSCLSKLYDDNIIMTERISLLLMIVLGIMLSFYLLFDNIPVRNGICFGAIFVLLIIYDK